MKNQQGFTVIEMTIAIIILISIIGWVSNIVKLTNCDFESPYKCEVVHTVGIIPPVGAITGWIDVGK